MARACVFQPEMSPLGNVPFPPSSCANFPKIIPLNFDQALTHSRRWREHNLRLSTLVWRFFSLFFHLISPRQSSKLVLFPTCSGENFSSQFGGRLRQMGVKSLLKGKNSRPEGGFFPGARTFRLINIRKKESEFGCVTYHIRKSINAQLGSIHPGRNGEFG